jgi:hypothetical protein
MNNLLSTKSVVELLAGLALLLAPSTLISLLLGETVELPGGTALARFAGAILIALGGACWIARNHSQSRWAGRLLAVLLVYDFSVIAALLAARLGSHLSGIALWPAVFLHSGLAAWSLSCLRKKTR